MASLYEDLADEEAVPQDANPAQEEQSTAGANLEDSKEPQQDPLEESAEEGKEARFEGPSEGQPIPSKSDAPNAEEAPESTSDNSAIEVPLVFVGGLAWSTTEAGLQMYMEQFGEVKQIDFKKGFAFVHFVDKAASEACIAAGSKHMIDGKQVEVKVSEPHLANRSRQMFYGGSVAGSYGTAAGAGPTRSGMMNSTNGVSFPGNDNNNEQITQAQLDELQNSRDAPGMNVGKKVFVGGLSQDVREPELKQMMEHHGTIEDVVVMIDRFTKRSRGFGFVTFSTQEEAINSCKQRMQKLGGKMCEVKLYEPGAKGNFYHQRSGPGGGGYDSSFSQPTGSSGYQHSQTQDWTSHRPFSGGGGGYRGGGGAGGRGTGAPRGYPPTAYGGYGGYGAPAAAGYYGEYSQQQGWGAQAGYGAYQAWGGYGQQGYGGAGAYGAPPATGGAPPRGGGYAGQQGGRGGGDGSRPPYQG